ncbi:unnamed protein product [Vitrella brassicaformis CCMP3155]|uniref:Uncharacterized protein n=1 Tax=Vitrella brassicaformis (strain CCMP3155) TaxID=1169540 RepID=A0A0G4ECI1_VITBC|nr:unnamed protein product [Vitrella brassicaformis CCMP3155]|eukprot:CEL93249.1 unnamed protein product [Vitrella brassicaformis CCMP3155]
MRGSAMAVPSRKLIREGERPAKRGEDVAGFLRADFIDKASRFLVFSSHSTGTGQKLLRYMQSHRDIIRPRLPVFRSRDEMTALTKEASPPSLCYLGLTPALVHSAYNLMHGRVTACIQDRFSRLKAPPFNKHTVRALIETAVKGEAGGADELGEWLQALDAFGLVGSPPSYTWPPCFLAAACHAMCEADAIPIRIRQGLVMIGDSLQQLATAEEGSGKQWEGVCAAALVLRMMQSEMVVGSLAVVLSEEAKQLLPDAILNGSCAFAGTFCPTHQSGFVRQPAACGLVGRSDPADIPLLRRMVLKELRRQTYKDQRLDRGTVALFVKPAVSSFPVHDLFIFICDDGRVTEIWGYQCKTGRQTPTDRQTRVSKKVTKSVWLRGEANQQTHRNYGWVVASQTVIELLFGLTLSKTCPLHWLADQ